MASHFSFVLFGDTSAVARGQPHRRSGYLAKSQLFGKSFGRQAMEKSGANVQTPNHVCKRLHSTGTWYRNFYYSGARDSPALADHRFGKAKTVTLGFPPTTPGNDFLLITAPFPETTATYCALCAE